MIFAFRDCPADGRCWSKLESEVVVEGVLRVEGVPPSNRGLEARDTAKNIQIIHQCSGQFC